MADGAFRSPFDPGHDELLHRGQRRAVPLAGAAQRARPVRRDGRQRRGGLAPGRVLQGPQRGPQPARTPISATNRPPPHRGCTRGPGQPYKTQDLVRRIQKELFSSAPDGLVGNDDLGAMGSWYVWSAIGLFPAIPGRAELLVNTPLFDTITIKRPAGDLVVNAPGSASRYVKTLKVNGVATTKAWLPESIAQRGGRLDFTTSTVPSTAFGSSPADAPPAFNGGAKPVLLGLNPAAAPSSPAGRSRPRSPPARPDRTGASVRWEAKPPPGDLGHPDQRHPHPRRGRRRLPPDHGDRPRRHPARHDQHPDHRLRPGLRRHPAERGQARHPRLAPQQRQHRRRHQARQRQRGRRELQLLPPRRSPRAASPRRGGRLERLHLHLAEPQPRRMGRHPARRQTPGRHRPHRRHPDRLPRRRHRQATRRWTRPSPTPTAPRPPPASGMSDWLLDFGGGSPSTATRSSPPAPTGCTAARGPCNPSRRTCSPAQPIPLNPAKKLKSITFGPSDEGTLHIFTWAFL